MLIQAWRTSGLSALRPRWFWSAAVRSEPGPSPPARRTSKAPQPPERLRNFYAGSDVVVVPSVPTRDFREPWGLVVNEAFNQGVPVIATDAVGAVAGGLVRHERTGLVVPAGDVGALAAALRRLHDDPALRARLGADAREAVAAYTHDAWAAGMSRGAERPRERRMRPASVNSMLRLALACLVLGLIVAVPAANAASTTRSCATAPTTGRCRATTRRRAAQGAPEHPDGHRRVHRLP